jgi:hypothetical protein
VFASTVLNNMRNRPEVEPLDRLQCNLLDDYEKLDELAGRLEDLFPSEE